MSDYTVGETFYFGFTTRAFATGIPIVLSGTPVISAYEDAGLTQITAGITLGVDHDSVVGFNMITVVATGGNGFEAGKDYNLVVTTGTVGGVSVVGEVVGRFTLGRSAAAVDLANSTDGLGALKILIDTIDDFLDTEIAAITAAVITNAAGADIAADIIALKAETVLIVADTGELQTDWVNGGRLDLILDELTVQGDTNETKIDIIDINIDQIEVAVITNAAGVDIAADIIALKAETVLIVADTNELQTDDVPGLIAALNDPTSASIADAVWDEAVAGHVSAGTFGKTDADILADTNELQGDWVDGGRLDLLIDAILADTGELQTDWVDGGRLDVIIDAILADTGTDGVALAADSITAGVIATDAFGALELATDAVNEIRDAIYQGTLNEGYASDGSAATLEEILYMIYAVVGEFAISGTTITTKQLDGSTTAMTHTLDDGTNPTSRTRAT